MLPPFSFGPMFAHFGNFGQIESPNWRMTFELGPMRAKAGPKRTDTGQAGPKSSWREPGEHGANLYFGGWGIPSGIRLPAGGCPKTLGPESTWRPRWAALPTMGSGRRQGDGNSPSWATRKKRAGEAPHARAVRRQRRDGAAQCPVEQECSWACASPSAASPTERMMSDARTRNINSACRPLPKFERLDIRLSVGAARTRTTFRFPAPALAVKPMLEVPTRSGGSGRHLQHRRGAQVRSKLKLINFRPKHERPKCWRPIERAEPSPNSGWTQ